MEEHPLSTHAASQGHDHPISVGGGKTPPSLSAPMLGDVVLECAPASSKLTLNCWTRLCSESHSPCTQVPARFA